MPQSYKIFIKDTPVMITEGDFSPGGWEYVITEPAFREDIPGTINWLLDHHFGNKAVILAASASDLFEEIKKQLRNVTAAGGLVRNDLKQLLMIYRRGRWDLPKGKLETDEPVEDAAIREVIEETGLLNLTITGKARETWHIYKEYNELILKDTHWYHMQTSDNHEVVPQVEEGIIQVEWVSKKEIPLKMTNTFASVKDLLVSVGL
jgi:8-oxo-dGTP pyrophosphatase MutT (NUDIX family)